MGGKSWCKQGVRYWQRNDYEVLEELRVKYPATNLLHLMGINRSGYYKWRKRRGKPNRYEQDRVLLTEFLQTHGYHRLAKDVFEETGWVFSEAHQCCKNAGIRSKARKYTYRRLGKESAIFPNEVCGHWDAARPIEIVVSDMTMLKVGKKYWEWTLLRASGGSRRASFYRGAKIRRPRILSLGNLVGAGAPNPPFRGLRRIFTQTFFQNLWQKSISPC